MILKIITSQWNCGKKKTVIINAAKLDIKKLNCMQLQLK